MKHHIAVKFVAVFLAALTLLAAIGSAVSVIGLASQNLYEESVSELYEEQMASTRRSFAVNLVHRYASLELGNIPEGYLDYYHGSTWLYDTFEYGQYCYVIKDENGSIVASDLFEDLENATRYEINVTDIRYRRLLQGLLGTAEGDADEAANEVTPADQEPDPGTEPDSAEETATGPDATAETTADITDETKADTASAEENQGLAVASDEAEELAIFQDGYYDYEQDVYVEISYQYADLPPHTVELYLFPGAMPEEPLWNILKILWVYRYELFYVLGISLLAFAAAAVYLFCAAGRKPGTREVRPGGLNCIPLDLYLLVGAVVIFFAVALGAQVAYYLVGYSPQVFLPFVLLAGYGCCLLFVGFCFACAAQFKTPGGYWWRHSVIGWCLIRIGRGFRWIFRGIRAVVRVLPIIWQWLLTAFLMVCGVLFCLIMVAVTQGIFAVFWLFMLVTAALGCIAVVCYGGWCLGTLIRGARYMAQGNIYYQIPTQYLTGAFRDCAIQLNSLAGAAQIAAERQLRSERMKTELITNVSHDIKTPLTSIINYVDLMKKPHSQQEDQAYLEVLDRQSQRLKKLIDDLMEMSKASTGNMSVEVSRMDAAETINQALGEFSDKLERASLIPVFRIPENPVYMLADGRLVWRVMSNLLSNAVKYAMPGTRLYIDLVELEGRVIISLKNISREELNVRADELLERFVRGDASRNTEGSGLGLNIAQSLMELQKGQLQLLVDGDLFKATLIFPAA